MNHLPLNKYIINIIKKYLPLPYINELHNKVEKFDDQFLPYINELHKVEKFDDQFKGQGYHYMYIFPIIRKHYFTKYWSREEHISTMDFRELYFYFSRKN